MRNFLPWINKRSLENDVKNEKDPNKKAELVLSFLQNNDIGFDEFDKVVKLITQERHFEILQSWIKKDNRSTDDFREFLINFSPYKRLKNDQKYSLINIWCERSIVARYGSSFLDMIYDHVPSEYFKHCAKEVIYRDESVSSYKISQWLHKTKGWSSQELIGLVPNYKEFVRFYRIFSSKPEVMNQWVGQNKITLEDIESLIINRRKLGITIEENQQNYSSNYRFCEAIILWLNQSDQNFSHLKEVFSAFSNSSKRSLSFYYEILLESFTYKNSFSRYHFDCVIDLIRDKDYELPKYYNELKFSCHFLRMNNVSSAEFSQILANFSEEKDKKEIAKSWLDSNNSKENLRTALEKISDEHIRQDLTYYWIVNQRSDVRMKLFYDFVEQGLFGDKNNIENMLARSNGILQGIYGDIDPKMKVFEEVAINLYGENKDLINQFYLEKIKSPPLTSVVHCLLGSRRDLVKFIKEMKEGEPIQEFLKVIDERMQEVHKSITGYDKGDIYRDCGYGEIYKELISKDSRKCSVSQIMKVSSTSQQNTHSISPN